MEKTGRTKGSKNINDSLKSRILAIKAINPDWSAEQIRQHLQRTKHITNGYSQVPKKRAIQTILSNPENKSKISSIDHSTDTPWHMGLLEQYKIPSDAVPSILIVQSYLDNSSESVLTIRQVLWLSRLTGLTGNYKPKDTFKVAEKLWRWSKSYAEYEIIWQLLGKSLPADTTELDVRLRKGDIPEVVTVKDAGKRIMMFSKDRHISMIPPWKDKDGEK